MTVRFIEPTVSTPSSWMEAARGFCTEVDAEPHEEGMLSKPHEAITSLMEQVRMAILSGRIARMPIGEACAFATDFVRIVRMVDPQVKAWDVMSVVEPYGPNRPGAHSIIPDDSDPTQGTFRVHAPGEFTF